MQAAKLDHDLGLEERPHEAEFDDFLLHVDGWLCEIKDVQIRDGLHVLGAAPAGDARVDLVLAMLRARQMWGGEQSLPGLREALGLRRRRARRPGSTRSRRWRTPSSRAWRPPAGTRRGPASSPSCRTRSRANVPTRANPRVGVRRVARPSHGRQVERVLRFAAEEVVPRLDATAERDPARPARPRRRLRPGRAVRLAAARAGQRAADRPQLLLRRPQGRPVAAGLGDRAGDGRVAGRALPARPRRRVPASRRPVASGARQRDAHVRRRHRRGLRAARRPPGLGRGVAPRRRPRGDRPRRAGPPAHRRHRAHLRLLPRRVPARARAARRRRADWSPPSTSPPSSNFVPRPRRPRTSDRPPRGSSAPSPAPTAPACCSSSTPATGATTPTSPRSTRPGAATPTAAASTASPPAARWRPPTGASRSRRRTPTPASTTSPTPTTTTSTTAA